MLISARAVLRSNSLARATAVLSPSSKSEKSLSLERVPARKRDHEPARGNAPSSIKVPILASYSSTESSATTWSSVRHGCLGVRALGPPVIASVHLSSQLRETRKNLRQPGERYRVPSLASTNFRSASRMSA